MTKVREDLKDVSHYIFRLLSIGEKFSEHNRSWAHYKNKEDYQKIALLPDDEGDKANTLYAEGRDIAIHMSYSLNQINYDFNEYPTLTSIIEYFKNGCVYGNYNEDRAKIVLEVCENNNIHIFAINQMAELFLDQISLLKAVRVTLKILANSDLYKLENGIEIMSEIKQTVIIGNVQDSSLNINSPGATASVSQVYNEPEIFKKIISSIQESNLDSNTISSLIEETNKLASCHKDGSYKTGYKEFIKNIADHVSIFTPFMSMISNLL